MFIRNHYIIKRNIICFGLIDGHKTMEGVFFVREKLVIKIHTPDRAFTVFLEIANCFGRGIVKRNGNKISPVETKQALICTHPDIAFLIGKHIIDHLGGNQQQYYHNKLTHGYRCFGSGLKVIATGDIKNSLYMGIKLPALKKA